MALKRAAIRQAVAEEYELQVYAVVLIKPTSLPKTSSGKVQRYAARTAFLEGHLAVLGSNILNQVADARPHDAAGLTRYAIARGLVPCERPSLVRQPEPEAVPVTP